MEQSRFRDILPELRAELKDARRRLMTAQGDVEALEKAISGLEYFAEPTQLPLTPADTNGASESDAPRGRAAVLRVMSESGRAMRPAEVIEEIERRGWIDPAAKDPGAAIRIALRRLADGKDVAKVGAGLYEYVPPVEEVGARTEA